VGIVVFRRLHCGYCSNQVLFGPPYGSWGQGRLNKIKEGEAWEGETVFLTGRVTSHDGMYKEPISELALRAYDHSRSSCDLISILSSNKLRIKIRRCPVDAALSYRADLTSEAMARFIYSL